MGSPRKVYVPQSDGEITLTPDGDVDAARTFRVDAHLVSPRSNDEQQELLLRVEGARLATAKDEPTGSSSSAAAGSPS